jgi:hypothetical protein
MQLLFNTLAQIVGFVLGAVFILWLYKKGNP